MVQLLCITHCLSFPVYPGPLQHLLNVPEIACNETGNAAFIAFQVVAVFFIYLLFFLIEMAKVERISVLRASSKIVLLFCNMLCLSRICCGGSFIRRHRIAATVSSCCRNIGGSEKAQSPNLPKHNHLCRSDSDCCSLDA